MSTVSDQPSKAAILIKNAKEKPKVFYGKHMSPGVAEYREQGQEPVRILVNESAIREMDPTFAGCPVYVRHVEQVDLNNIQAEADGYVIESFFNAADSAHWCKFIVVSDKGHSAIRAKWKLSNAYKPRNYAQGGISKGVEYQKEVVSADYDHLAIVDDPRYEDSIILTPDEFKSYNSDRIISLNKINNANIVKPKGLHNMFKFFKKSEVETTELDTTIVKLSDGREVTIAQLINEADAAKPEMKAEEKMPAEKPAEAAKGEGKPEMANEEHHVAMKNGESMSVKDLRDRHDKMQECMNTLSEMAKPKEEKAEESSEKPEAKAPEAKPESLDAKKNEDDSMSNSKNADLLKNAPTAALTNSSFAKASAFVGVELGRQRYGSGN